MRRARPVAATLVALALVAGAASCGVSDQGDVATIDGAEVPYGLGSTTSTTTTTTTLPETTAPQATSTTVAEATTSTIAQEPVTLYFPYGNRLRPITVAATAPATASQMIALLLNGPPDGVGLREVIPLELRVRSAITVETTDGVATVNLPAEVFDGMSPNDQRLLVGQLVLTILSSVRGVGQVRFTLGGDPLSVYLYDASRSDPDQHLTWADYQQLIEEVEPPQITTTTDVASSAGAPPPGAEPAA